MSVSEINDTGDQTIRKSAVDLLTSGKSGIDYALRIKALGLSPLAGLDWKSHSKSVASNIVTYQFFRNPDGTDLLITATLTYSNNSLKDLVSSRWDTP